MERYDERLQELRTAMERRSKLTAKSVDLQQDVQRLTHRLAQREREHAAEQADVDKLEGFSLKGLFHGLMGTRDETLEREREEALAAREQLDTTARELDVARAELERVQRELARTPDPQQEYNALLTEKAEVLKMTGGPAAARLTALEEQTARLAAQEKELLEALRATERAQDRAAEVQGSLDKAADWGTCDLIGGGLVADLCKHDALDTAQRQLEGLRAQLVCLNGELDDVDIRGDFSVNVEGFLQFADFFFDGLFADMAVQDHIQQSRARMTALCEQLRTLHRRLNNLAQTAAENRARVRMEWQRLTEETPL